MQQHFMKYRESLVYNAIYMLENKGKWIKQSYRTRRQTMKFENKGKWFMESEEQINTDDLLAEDELNLAEEDIDDDSEGIFNKEADKKPEQKNERHLFKKGDRVNALGNTGTIASVYYEDPAETRKRFKVLMDKNKKVEVFTEPELRFVESAQKNEDKPNNSSSLPYAVANSRLQPIEYFKDVKTASRLL